MDNLDLVIGFSSIMLMFSIVVTALVQMTQSLFRLRAKNLFKGLTVILGELGDQDAETNARKVMLNQKNDPLRKIDELPDNKMPFNHDLAAKWIDTSSIKLALEGKDVSTFDDGKIALLEQRFDQVAPWLTDRFVFQMRCISVIWAIVIAFSFQLSAFDILRQLSTDKAFLEKAMAYRESQSDSGLPQSIDKNAYHKAGESALNQLEREYPNLKTHFESVSGQGASKQDILYELELLLAEQDLPKEDEIKKRFNDLLDAALVRHLEVSASLLNEHLSEARALNFGFYPDPRFYVGPFSMSNLMGVIITAIFLTFGAPFWFEVLKKTSAIKDAFKSGTTGTK